MIEGLQWIRQIAYPWRISIAFCIATVMVLLGLIWMTILVIRLERSEANAKQGAELEENLRLALWRIDSTLSPILAQESFRPNSVPSTSPYVKLCFQFAPDGSLSTPKLSQTAQRDQLIQEFSQICLCIWRYNLLAPGVAHDSPRTIPHKPRFGRVC